jgi:hypothetical protein
MLFGLELEMADSYFVRLGKVKQEKNAPNGAFSNLKGCVVPYNYLN